MARVTVVNDYPAFLELMESLLGDAGHEVHGFDGQMATIDEIAATQPDLLIIDILVEGQASTGWDVLALARAHDQLRSVPIVVATADVVQTDRRRDELEQLGDIRVLAKPFGAEELDRTIAPLLPR